MSKADKSHTTRREVLARGAGVAALAIMGAAAIPARAEDELLGIINQYKAEFERFDAYHATHDGPRTKELEDAFDRALDDYDQRQHALLRSAYGVRAGAASSVAFLDILKDEIKEGESIFSEHYLEIMKSVRVYIASTA